MYNGKYQRHMVASCTYRLETIISWLLNKSQTK